jgi:hypothetical protein
MEFFMIKTIYFTVAPVDSMVTKLTVGNIAKNEIPAKQAVKQNAKGRTFVFI